MWAPNMLVVFLSVPLLLGKRST